MGCGASKNYAQKLPADWSSGEETVEPEGDSEPVTAAALALRELPVVAATPEAPVDGQIDFEGIAAAQRKRNAIEDDEGYTSVKLDPAYAETLQLKVAHFCEQVGGFEKMFNIADLDRSQSLDVYEFRKLLMNMPVDPTITGIRREPLQCVGQEIICRGMEGKKQTLKPKTKPAKQKPITKREATALFWYLDEDESDFIEPDEFEAWLRTGGLIRVTNRNQPESYRRPQAKEYTW